ncbi:MAG: protein-glutamate methylesterase/protein-glutamine glutaminase [Geminicoccaceae bacterium]
MQNCSIDAVGGRHIRVLVVDDSALMRQMLRSVLESDADIEVVGTAPDPLSARQMIKDLNPDVITLDIEMPRMDGLSFLEKIMTLRPMPVIMVSSLTKRGAETTLRALECGAVDFVTKPSGDAKECITGLKADLIPKVKAAADARVGQPAPKQARSSRPRSARRHAGTNLIALGASTGGVAALQTVLAALPPTSPGIVIVQHMPPAFTKSFAARLNQNSALTVSEARTGEPIQAGHAYVAPGGHHLEVTRGGQGFRCHVYDGPMKSGHRPSVDLLFQSVARFAGAKAVGAILTGMGRDGAEGLLAMRDAGAMTLGQDQASCVVYGMPRAAMEIGAVITELSLEEIGKEICSASQVAVKS